MYYVGFFFLYIYLYIGTKKSWLTKFKESVHHLYAAVSVVLKVELKNLWTHFRTYRKIILLRETRGRHWVQWWLWRCYQKQTAITTVVALSFIVASINNEFFDLRINEWHAIYDDLQNINNMFCWLPYHIREPKPMCTADKNKPRIKLENGNRRLQVNILRHLRETNAHVSVYNISQHSTGAHALAHFDLQTGWWSLDQKKAFSFFLLYTRNVCWATKQN